MLDLLRRTIRPEFLNRIDETIVFHPLQRDEIRQVVRLQLDGIERMLEQNGVTMRLDEKAVDLLTDEGYDPEFGARPVKRAIQRMLLNNLSKALLAGSIDRGKPIVVSADGESLTFGN